MKLETLQSLSTACVFIGLFITALGAFGALRFGRQQEEARKQDRTELTRDFTGAVTALKQEQQELRERLASLEQHKPAAAEPATPSVIATPAVPKIGLVPPGASSSQPVAIPSLSVQPPAAMTEPLLSIPSVLPKDQPVELPAQPAAELQPPKLSPPALSVSEPANGAPKEEGSLTGEKRVQLVKRLQEFPKQEIVIRAAAADALALKLALSLKSVFREAGWKVGEVEMVNQPLPKHTLLLSSGVLPPPKEFVGVYTALAGSGFLVTSDLDPNQRRERVVVSVGPQ